MKDVLADPAVVTLFAAQLGVATRAQLRAAGPSSSTIARALRSGELAEILPGVARPSARPLSFEGRLMAAQLYCGPTSYITGSTAGRLCGLREMPARPDRLAVRVRFRAKTPAWLHVARTTTVRRNEIIEREDGLRVARPHLMLLALAHELDDRGFARAAEDAWHQGLATPSSAGRYLEELEGSGRRGMARLRRWLGRTGGRDRPAQSGFELDVIDALAVVGLPEPERQYPVLLPDGKLVHLDLAWPDVRLAVEPGHSWWHGGDEATRADLRRDRLCSRVGWLVMRFDEEARKELDAAAWEVLDTYRVRVQQMQRPPSGHI